MSEVRATSSFEKLGQHRIAGDFGETNVKLAREPDRLGQVAAGFRRRRGDKVGAQLLERRRIGASRGRKHDRPLDRAARLEDVARLPRVRALDESAAIHVQRHHAALGEHDQNAANLRAATLESRTERALRQFRAGRQLLLHNRGDDPLDDACVRERLTPRRPL